MTALRERYDIQNVSGQRQMQETQSWFFSSRDDSSEALSGPEPNVQKTVQFTSDKILDMFVKCVVSYQAKK